MTSMVEATSSFSRPVNILSSNAISIQRIHTSIVTTTVTLARHFEPNGFKNSLYYTFFLAVLHIFFCILFIKLSCVSFPQMRWALATLLSVWRVSEDCRGGSQTHAYPLPKHTNTKSQIHKSKYTNLMDCM